MVNTLLLFLRAVRTSDWDLHIESSKQMIPWMFAADHQNYCRSLVVYLLQMVQIEKTNPQAFKELKAGFAVQRSTGNGFGQVPVDQTIEQTVNRSSKLKGHGITNFSTKPKSVDRWVATAHKKAALTSNLMVMAGVYEEDEFMHKDDRESRKVKDEICVQAVKDKVSRLIL